MENKILNLLSLATRASSKMDIRRLELLSNQNNEAVIIGEDFLSILRKLKDEDLIAQDLDFRYSITPKGEEYLKILSSEG